MLNTETTDLTVLISHREPLLAAGLAASLHPLGDLQVLAAGAVHPSGRRVDVVVTDYAAAMRLLADIRGGRAEQSLADARVMVVTLCDREHDIRQALERGVHGYLLVDAGVDELISGVRALGRGARYLSGAVAHRMAESLTRESLTLRESEVLNLVARGECNKTIARDLSIAIGTVKAHVKAILAKLEASSRTQAARIAAERGLIDAPDLARAWSSVVHARTGGLSGGAAAAHGYH